MPSSLTNRLFAVLVGAVLTGCATPAPEVPRYTRVTTDPGYQSIQKTEYALNTTPLSVPEHSPPEETATTYSLAMETESKSKDLAPYVPKSILHLSKIHWDLLTETEQEQLSYRFSIQTHESDRYGVITDVQTVDQSTAGTSGGAALGGAVASAAYIDRAFRGGNSYSAGANLAIGILGAILGSAALDSAPVNKFQTRYTVKLADGEVQYFDETKGDAFRHSSGICIHVPELSLAAQGLCSQTAESLRSKHLSAN